MFKNPLILSVALLAIFSSEINAQVSDEMINPFLGPYKIEKSNVGACPEFLTMIAECTLDQLDLKNSKNLDFDYLTFKGINSGEMITSIKNKVVEKSITILNGLTLISKRSSYMKNYKVWFNETVELDLGPKKFSVKKSQLDIHNKNSKATLNCDYVFDEEENKRMLDELKKSHP
jgi:hypothetical protein